MKLSLATAVTVQLSVLLLSSCVKQEGHKVKFTGMCMDLRRISISLIHIYSFGFSLAIYGRGVVLTV